MNVLPFRKPSPVSQAPARGLTIAEQVEAVPASVALDLTGLRRIDGPPGEDGSAQVTYTAALEVQVRQLVARLGMPRVPFTAAELDALTAYGAFLESARADGVDGADAWRASLLEQAEKHHPGYAPGLRLFLAHNLPGLTEHHRTACGYPELVKYAADYY